jgi:hypothetical protein
MEFPSQCSRYSSDIIRGLGRGPSEYGTARDSDVVMRLIIAFCNHRLHFSLTTPQPGQRNLVGFRFSIKTPVKGIILEWGDN